MMGGFGMMTGMGWLGILTMIIFWLGVVALVVWGISNLAATPRPDTSPDAQEMLKQRYARGEISYEEFMQAREALR